jgi:GH15 family glucan-1,4-alpha-glucosidase
MTDLRARSIEIILTAQAPSGAYPACLEFPTYRYSWFRDGSFIAYAMDLVGEHESARQFHHWAAAAIIRRADLVERAVGKARAGRPLELRDVLHTRYGLEGEPVEDGDWPNFQLDGFGTWLWALGDHHRRNGTEVKGPLRAAADLTALYLAALWRLPCYDCWEEFPDRVHPHTLAAIAAGMRAHQEMAGIDHTPELEGIARCLYEDALIDGAFIKSLGNQDVDASLVGLTTPYDVIDALDPRMEATIDLIERKLMNGGGVRRYSTDTYYGGGEWVLLTAWLAWHHRRQGNDTRAEQLLHWVEEQADDEYRLPEQVPSSLNDPAYYQVWVERWGEIARPLLWSHAMYLIAGESPFL